MLDARWRHRRRSNPNASFSKFKTCGKAISSNFIGLFKIGILLDDF